MGEAVPQAVLLVLAMVLAATTLVSHAALPVTLLLESDRGAMGNAIRHAADLAHLGHRAGCQDPCEPRSTASHTAAGRC